MAAVVEGDCCSICLGEYKDPRILPCQHVFCLQCLCDYVAKKKQINCPNCMTEVDIPPGGIADLLKYVEEPLQASPEPEVCNVCEKGIQASFQCFECDKCMCDACKKFHDVFSSKHQVHELEKSDSSCENHPEVVLQFYCKICKCLICQQCIDNDHNSKHIVLGIEDYFTEIKKQFEVYLETIDAKLQKISKVTDSFISKETTSVYEVMQRVPQLQTELKVCQEKAWHRKKINSEDDQILSKKLSTTIKHLDKPLNQSENIKQLFDLTFNLESKIQTHGLYFLRTDIDKTIEDEMGTLDVTIGRLFSFPLTSLSFESEVFFVGGIHWTMSVTAQNYEKKVGATVTLKSFVKEEDKQLVDSVTTDLVFTFIFDDVNSVVNKQSKTFSLSDLYNWYTCKFLYCDTSRYSTGKNIQILFDIKEIKYKNN